MKKQVCKPIWKRCFTFALAAALVVQMIGTPSLTAFAADDTAITTSASDLKQEEAPAEEVASEKPVAKETATEIPAVEEAAVEDVSAPALKAAPSTEAETEDGEDEFEIEEDTDVVVYLDADGNEQSTTNYTVVESSTSTVTWSTGDYVVESDSEITISGHIVVKGAVNLILCDGAKLKASSGIGVAHNDNGNLTIYAQSTGDSMGALQATAAVSSGNTYAPIGGYGKKKNDKRQAGIITINGGNITATAKSSQSCAAIGGIQSFAADNITINGGIVTATVSGSTSDDYAAIGFGYNGNKQAGTVTINGGRVSATGPSGIYGYGIGAKDGITLSHSHYTDSIYASGYNLAPTLNSDFMIKGTTTHATGSNAGGKTIVPRYKITFYDMDGTTVINEMTAFVAGGETLATVPTYTPAEGYIFKGWKDKTTGETFISNEVIKGDRELVADCEKDECTVIFYNWDGSVIKTVTVTRGQRPELPEFSEVGTRPGYNFTEGWLDKETGEPFADTDVITSDRELISEWKPISYKITYNLDGGALENENDNPVNYTIETDTFTLVNPTREGYEFIGWSGTDIEGTSTEVTISQGSMGNREYTANWEKLTFTVTFDVDEGSELKVYAVEKTDEYGNTEGGDYIESGAKVGYGIVLEITATAKTGYELTESPKDTVTVTDNTTITVRSQKKTFALTVAHENGAEPDVNCGEFPVDAIPYGTEVTVTAGQANEGYEFIGFYRSNGVLLGSDVSYTFAMTADTAIEARYQEIGHYVTFMSNGQVFETKSLTSFTANDFPKSNPPAIDGFKFVGWSMDAEEINTALQNGNVTVQAEFEAVAQTFTVTIYNGEEDDYEEVVCEKSTLITRTAAKVNGKVFAYWTIAYGTDDERILSYNTKASFTATKDCTLKAVYTEEAVEAIGTATIRTAKYNMESRKLTFNAYLTVPDNTTIVAAGLVAAQEGDFTGDLTTENAQFNKSLATAVGKCAPVNYTWNKTNVDPGDVWCVRAHLVYTENGTNKEIYGPLITVRAGTDYDYAEKGTAVLRTMSYNKDTKVATFNVYLTVPDNATIVKAGLVAASANSDNFDPETEMLTSANADYCKSLAAAVGKCAPVNYTWNKTNVNEDWYVRAWLVYDLDGVRHTVYGDQELFKLASFLE